MPKVAKELSAVEVRRLAERKPDGSFHFYPVGGVPGLLLRVSDSGAAYWVLRYAVGTRVNAKGVTVPHRRDLGLGGFPEVSLKVARELARSKRAEVRDGGDPVEARRAARKARQAALDQRMTFQEAVAHARELEGITDDKAGKAWDYKINTYALPKLGSLPVDEIEHSHIVAMLKPIWSDKTRTAKDVRKLVEDVLDRAYAAKNIGRRNPARWDKVLRKQLPKETKKGTNFPALPFTQIHTFLEQLRQSTDPAAKLVEFVIYTGARSGEVCGATWKEIDLHRRLWIIPAERMKKGEEHRVHLSGPALALLQAQEHGRPDDPVFPTVTGKFYHDARLSAVTREIGQAMGFQATVHGFRATFRTWGEEETEYPDSILEMALAHKIDDAVKAAYQRGDLLKKRRQLMNDWAAYCAKPPRSPSVTPLKRASA